MARKKAKVSSKDYINDCGNGSGGVSDANAGCSSSSAAPLVVVDFVGSGGGDHNSSASKGGVVALAAPVNDHQTRTEKGLVDNFYEKLVKLHQSSGLSLAFNFRETKVDLYMLYRKVIERGGFHQVSKEGKWNEVASTLNLKIQVSLLPDQIQKVYESLILQYEQMHYYRTPANVSTKPGLSLNYGNCSECSPVKQKSCDNSSHDDQVGKRKNVLDIKASTGKRMPYDNSSHHNEVAKGKGALDINRASTGPGTPEQKSNVQIHFDDKDIKDLQLPIKTRTAYQIFIKKECERLKMLHGESSSNMNYRNMATEAWKRLSQSDRLVYFRPYIEASKKDKERFNRDMIIYEQIWNQKIAKKQKLLSNSTPSLINLGPASLTDDGYHVTLEANAGNFFVPDESLIESTIQILKDSRPNDPMFQINWDGCCGSPDS